jgi:hypothetical protein
MGPVEVDERYVYWAESTPAGNSIMVAPKDGSGEPRRIGPWFGYRSPEYFAVDATHLYWHHDGVLIKASKNADWAIEEIPFADADIRAATVQDDRYVFIAEYFCRGVWRVPKASDEEPLYIELLVPERGDMGGVTGLAADATHLYCGRGHRIQKVPKQGGEITVLVSDGYSIGPVYVDETYVYWWDDDYDERGFTRIPVGGGGSEPLFAMVAEAGRLLFDDERQRFFLMGHGGHLPTDVVAFDPDQRTADVIASAQHRSGGLAHDDEHVYWASHQVVGALPDGVHQSWISIRRVAKD